MPFPEPPQNHQNLPDWVRDYLKPSSDRPTYKAHQFTINGVTYPFVRDFHFAAVPHPINRNYSMLSGLYLTRPGDLMFFFQSDPQLDPDDINSRRGLRGIFRVVSQPFQDTMTIVHPSSGYQILGKCPTCSSVFSNMSQKCINESCAGHYPEYILPWRPRNPYFFLNMSCRLELEPLAVFSRPVSDEKAYAFMSDKGMIWIGRHDNAMGPGKGSSIRQLIPEEAEKLTRLLLNEPDQQITRPSRVNYPNQKQTIQNEDGTPATQMEIERRVRAGNRFKKELSLNFHLARTIDNPSSNICQALSAIEVHDLEYVSSEFPWGYTAGTSDFLCSFANDGKRYKIIVMELKRGAILDDAVIQVSLYVPWVVQTMCQFANRLADVVEVVPVFIGNKLTPGVVRPAAYNYRASFNSGISINVNVQSPVYLEYTPTDIVNNGRVYYAKDVQYNNRSDEVPQIDWKPLLGVVTTAVETKWVRDNSWQLAKEEWSRRR